jgi:hypothetical protein
MRIGKFELIFIYHRSELTQSFKEECGIWYYLPLKWSVIHYLRQGTKLYAVKLVKYRTNMGLKDSKDWVDKFQAKKKIY